MSACAVVKFTPYQDIVIGTKWRKQLEHCYVYIDIATYSELS